MSAYNDMTIAVRGLQADTATLKRVESAAATTSLNFGSPVFSYADRIDEVNSYNKDTSTLVVSDDLIAANSTVVTLDGVALSPVVFATDHATTMAAIVVAIQAAGYSAKLDATDTNSRTILITKEDNANLVVTAVTTLGLTQATWSATQSSQQYFRGIALFVQKEPSGYSATDTVTVMTNGEVYVETSKSVEALDVAYYDPATDKFTDSSSGTLDLGLVFKLSSSTAGISIVEVDGGKRLSTKITY